MLNLSYYIILGYILGSLDIGINGFVFYVPTLFLFSGFIVYFLKKNLKEIRKIFLVNSQKKENDQLANFNKFNFNYVKEFLSKNLSGNAVLLCCFIVLIIIFNIMRFTYFFGTDAWLHIHIIKKLISLEQIPFGDYHNTVGLHIYGAVIQLFSKMGFLMIPRYFVFFTFSISALIFYAILKRIFKKKDLAIFGVFLLEFSSLGFPYMMYQFWPSGLAFIQSLMIFFLLITRFPKFLNPKRPEKSKIISNIKLYYPLLTFLFLSSAFIHVLTTGIFILSFLWIYLMYFIKDIRRGFDFIFVICLLAVYLGLVGLGIGSGHFWFFSLLNMRFLVPLILFSAVSIVILSILIKKLLDSIKFSTGRFERAILGKGETQLYKNIEDKYLLPTALSISIGLSLLFLLGNILIFDLNFYTVLMGFEALILILLSLWGLIVYQKIPHGKYLFIWGAFFVFLIAFISIYDVLFGNAISLIGRITSLIAPLIVIGFISYIFKVIRLGTIKEKKMKLFILSVIIVSLFSAFMNDFIKIQENNISPKENNALRFFADQTTDKTVFYTEFGWDYVILYYDYPYSQDDFKEREEIIIAINYKEDLFKPENHYNKDGSNILKEYKEKYGTDVYLLVDDVYYLNKDWKVYGKLNQSEQEQYYNLTYLNKVYSAKAENGDSNPLWWVI